MTILLLLTGIWAIAQNEAQKIEIVTTSNEVISTAGGTISGNGITLQTTVGEVIQGGSTTGTVQLQQGFQPPTLTVTAINVSEIEEVEVSVYPNPSSDYLFVEVKGATDARFEVQLFDLNGRVLQTKEQEAANTQLRLDMQSLASGTYLIKVTDLQTLQVATYQVNKAN